MKLCPVSLLLVAVAFARTAPGSMLAPLSTEENLRRAEAVCRGTVLGAESFENPADGGIYTRARVRVDEVFKGRFAGTVVVVQRGGQVGRRGETVGCSVMLRSGDGRILFLARRADRSLYVVQGATGGGGFDEATLNELRTRTARQTDASGDVTDQAAPPDSNTFMAASIAASPPSVATNLLFDGNRVSSRYIAPDSGGLIPYLVDADALPSGVSLSQALNAVQEALAAWTAATGVRFSFEGVQSFGTAAANASVIEGKLGIQLHDLYGYIAEPQVLGQGGRSFLTSVPDVGTWGNGGKVGPSEFHRTVAGFVTLKHTDAFLQSTSTLAEVLCHEIGHALSMDHSSEDPAESWPDWREAIMYYRAHADGRGATLGAYDVRVVQQVLPIDNTPPASFDRVMDIVTQSSGAPNVVGINEIEARGYDLQGTNLTLQTTGSTTSEFGVTGERIQYTPDRLKTGARLDPADGSFYDAIYLRHSDGTNASAYASVHVISFMPDSSPSDGMPNAWMTTYFGTTSGTGNRAPNADFDGDGVTNLREFILGSNPTDAASNLRITSVSPAQIQFQAKPYELYEIHGSTNLTDWVRVMSPVIPTTINGVASGFTNAAPAFQFLRVLKVQ